MASRVLLSPAAQGHLLRNLPPVSPHLPHLTLYGYCTVYSSSLSSLILVFPLFVTTLT